MTADFEGGKIKLPKLKTVRAKLHREFEGRIKSATVSQVPSGKYYVSILVETEYGELPHTDKNIGFRQWVVHNIWLRRIIYIACMVYIPIVGNKLYRVCERKVKLMVDFGG